MPYANKEKKREYMRSYKAKLRRTKAGPPSLKVYFCPKIPNLIIGPIEFRGGFYVTGCPERQKYLERLFDYGKVIISWTAEPVLEEGAEFSF